MGAGAQGQPPAAALQRVPSSEGRRPTWARAAASAELQGWQLWEEGRRICQAAAETALGAPCPVGPALPWLDSWFGSWAQGQEYWVPCQEAIWGGGQAMRQRMQVLLCVLVLSPTGQPALGKAPNHIIQRGLNPLSTCCMKRRCAWQALGNCGGPYRMGEITDSPVCREEFGKNLNSIYFVFTMCSALDHL